VQSIIQNQTTQVNNNN